MLSKRRSKLQRDGPRRQRANKQKPNTQTRRPRGPSPNSGGSIHKRARQSPADCSKKNHVSVAPASDQETNTPKQQQPKPKPNPNPRERQGRHHGYTYMALGKACGSAQWQEWALHLLLGEHPSARRKLEKRGPNKPQTAKHNPNQNTATGPRQLASLIRSRRQLEQWSRPVSSRLKSARKRGRP